MTIKARVRRLEILAEDDVFAEVSRMTAEELHAELARLELTPPLVNIPRPSDADLAAAYERHMSQPLTRHRLRSMSGAELELIDMALRWRIDKNKVSPDRNKEEQG